MTLETLRDVARGRPFPKGKSGNVKGRPPGSRNRTTLAAEALLDGQAEAITQKVIELALKGNPTAIKISMDRILPPRRERQLSLELPTLRSAKDAIQTLTATHAAVAAGDITIAEAAALTKLVDTFLNALKVHGLEERVKDLEARNYVQELGKGYREARARHAACNSDTAYDDDDD